MTHSRHTNAATGSDTRRETDHCLIGVPSNIRAPDVQVLLYCAARLFARSICECVDFAPTKRSLTEVVFQISSYCNGRLHHKRGEGEGVSW